MDVALVVQFVPELIPDGPGRVAGEEMTEPDRGIVGDSVAAEVRRPSRIIEG